MPALRRTLIILSLSIFLATSLIVCNAGPKTPTDTVEAFLKDVKAGQYKKAFNMYLIDGEKEFAKLDDLDEFDNWGERLQEVTFTVLEQEVDGNEARVKYQIYDKKNDDTDTEWFELKLIDGSWKIDPEFL